MNNSRPFAIVTGASSGIGLELAREAAKRGYDLLIAADRRSMSRPRSCGLTAARSSPSKLTSPRAMVSRPCIRMLRIGALTHCSPMPATASARASSTRSSPKCST